MCESKWLRLVGASLWEEADSSQEEEGRSPDMGDTKRSPQQKEKFEELRNFSVNVVSVFKPLPEVFLSTLFIMFSLLMKR